MSPCVDNIMWHADPFHGYCVALVIPPPHAVEDWATKRAITFTSFSDLCQKEETVKEVHGSLVKVWTSTHFFYSFSLYLFSFFK